MHAYIMHAYGKVLDRRGFSFTREPWHSRRLRAARSWQGCAPQAHERGRLDRLLLAQDRYRWRRAASAAHGDRQSGGQVDLSAAHGTEVRSLQAGRVVPKM